MSETSLCKSIRLALNLTRRCRVVRNNVGVDLAKGVRYGLGNGSADLVGVLKSGRAFCVEIKTARGVTSEDQRAWHAALRRWGGFACVVRSVAEALAALDRAERGEAE